MHNCYHVRPPVSQDALCAAPKRHANCHTLWSIKVSSSAWDPGKSAEIKTIQTISFGKQRGGFRFNFWLTKAEPWIETQPEGHFRANKRLEQKNLTGKKRKTELEQIRKGTVVILKTTFTPLFIRPLSSTTTEWLTFSSTWVKATRFRSSQWLQTTSNCFILCAQLVNSTQEEKKILSSSFKLLFFLSDLISISTSFVLRFAIESTICYWNAMELQLLLG